ncbi:hypothetical protein SLA2020_204370 [Shorea laevis]
MRIPATFDRLAAAFDEAAARALGVRLCESSGSEHSPAADLSDLVNSYIEKECGDVNAEQEEKENITDESDWSESETKEKLEDLMGKFFPNGDKDEEVKQRLCAATEIVCQRICDGSSLPDFKRRLMSSLRDSGFDAGLCKSKWEKTERRPAGVYEYVDVIIDGERYIVEVNPATEFEIIRPTSGYMSLLDIFPRIFVGKAEELKQIVRLMCTAIRKSMKRQDMHVPPWRRNSYMQSKWFTTYKRTTNEVSSNSKSPKSTNMSLRTAVGFEAMPTESYHCRDDFVRKVGLKVGHLTAALNGS